MKTRTRLNLLANVKATLAPNDVYNIFKQELEQRTENKILIEDCKERAAS